MGWGGVGENGLVRGYERGERECVVVLGVGSACVDVWVVVQGEVAEGSADEVGGGVGGQPKDLVCVAKCVGFFGVFPLGDLQRSRFVSRSFATVEKSIGCEARRWCGCAQRMES